MVGSWVWVWVVELRVAGRVCHMGSRLRPPGGQVLAVGAVLFTL